MIKHSTPLYRRISDVIFGFRVVDAEAPELSYRFCFYYSFFYTKHQHQHRHQERPIGTRKVPPIDISFTDYYTYLPFRYLQDGHTQGPFKRRCSFKSSQKANNLPHRPSRTSAKDHHRVLGRCIWRARAWI